MILQTTTLAPAAVLILTARIGQVSSPLGTLGAPSKIASPHNAFVMDIGFQMLHAQCPPVERSRQNAKISIKI